MKLRNKKTGEIIETDFDLSISIPDDEKLYGCDTYTQLKGYTSLAELNEEWEDYEEPKKYWFMDYGGRIKPMNDANDEEDMARKQIGNYFETEEEAEKAVEKLKAWKRLKDKGFEFTKWEAECMSGKGTISTNFNLWEGLEEEVVEDLDLLFRSEDE